MALNLAYDSEYGVLVKDKIILKQLLDNIFKEKNILHVVVFDENVSPIVMLNQLSKTHAQTSNAIPLTTIALFNNNNKYVSEIKAGTLKISVPVKTYNEELIDYESLLEGEPDITPQTSSSGSTIIGYISMEISLKETISKLVYIRNWCIIIIGLLSMTFALLLSKIINAMVINPISIFAHGARVIANGNYDQQIDISTHDEIGQLTNAFNHMVRMVYNRTNELKKLNLLLVEQNEKLREMDRLKTEFLASMSHELRTPLNAIIGFSKVMLKGIDGPISDLQKNDLDIICSSGEHLLVLISDVLDLAKIESGRLELHKETLDIEDILNSVLDKCRPLADEKKISLTKNIDGKFPPLLADKTRVNQILLNIISNAIKFTYDGGVTVSAEVEDNDLLISISDTGIGIKKEDIPKIFERFRQLDGSNIRREGGTGLGLAITKELVEMHGGTIQVKSVPGAGSAFYVRIPLK